jgi:hypothetical protein
MRFQEFVAEHHIQVLPADRFVGFTVDVELPPQSGSPQTDVVRSIHRTFSKSTSRRQTKARASAPQR